MAKRSGLIWSMLLTFIFSDSSSSPLVTSALGPGGHLNGSFGFWSVFGNEAGLTGVQQFSAGFGGRAAYSAVGPVCLFACMASPAGRGVAGISVSSYGMSGYSETEISLAFARKFADNLHIGLRILYHRLDLYEYGSAAAGGFSAGIVRKIGKTAYLGIHLRNPLVNIMQQNDLPGNPTAYSCSVAWKLNRDFALAILASSAHGNSTGISCGITYRMADPMDISLGVTSGPLRFSFAFTLRLAAFEIGASSLFHQYLGHAPSFTMGYQTNE
jgi:hypothetical protein